MIIQYSYCRKLCWKRKTKLCTGPRSIRSCSISVQAAIYWIVYL